MTYPVLSTTASPSRIVPFGGGVIGLLIEFPETAARVLTGGQAEITTIEGEISALSAAETARRDAQQAEIAAQSTAEALVKEGRAWCGDLREKSRQLAQYQDGAAVLQSALVAPFPLPHEIR